MLYVRIQVRILIMIVGNQNVSLEVKQEENKLLTEVEIYGNNRAIYQ